MASRADNSGGRRGWSWWRILGWGFAATLMLLPAVAMQFTSEVNWTASDFVFAGVLIGGTGLLLELAARRSRSAAYRGGVALALLASFLLIWINGAVGIIGNEDNPANLMFLAVILIALVGSVLALFRPAGMAMAMAAAAGAQALIAAIALYRGLGASEPPGPLGIVLLIGFFVGLWLASAWLFKRAAELP